MNISTETLLGNANTSLNNAGGDVHDRHHSEWLIQESIAYSLLAIAQELKKFNDEAEVERERQENKLERKDEELDW